MGTQQFVDVTEIAGQKISAEQLERMRNRYVWASAFVGGKDVVEVGCGAGQGLDFLARHARSLKAGDISAEVLDRAKATYGERFDLRVFDAAAMPWADASFDTVILFEAIYYLPDVDAFFAEVKRVLRPGGMLLIATANKDLYDFVPSPFSVAYYGVQELAALGRRHGFTTEFWGFIDTQHVSLRQRVLRPVKSLASRLGLIPKTMRSKELLKRLFFGRLVDMPSSISDVPVHDTAPTPLPGNAADKRFKVIYCAARLGETVAQAGK